MADDSVDVLRGLLDELSTALSDAVEAMKTGQQGQDEICSGLADILEVLKAGKSRDDVGELAKAIRAVRIQAPDVQVSVAPAPVHVQVIEAKTPEAWQMDATYDDRDRLVRLLVFPATLPAVVEKVPRVIWPRE